MNIYVLLIQLVATATFAAVEGRANTRPTIRSTPYINQLERATYFNLDEALSQHMSGWLTEPEPVRAKFLALAQEYVSHRRVGRKDTAFAEKCLREPQRSVFCSIEATRVSVRAAAQSVRGKKSARSSHSYVVDQIRKGDLVRLKEVDRASLSRALKSMDDFDSLQPLAEKVINDPSCQASQLALAMAMEAEELFPNPKWIELTKRLYTRGAECGAQDDSAVVAARFRAGILSAWTGDCKSLEQQFAPLVNLPQAENYYSRIRYWRYHCAMQTKNMDVAKAMADDLAKYHPMSFQNLMINGDTAKLNTVLQNPDQPRVLFRSILNPELNDSARAVEALLQLKADDLAGDVVDVMTPQLSNSESGFRLYLVLLMNNLDSALPRFKLLALLFRDQPDMRTLSTLKLFFPLAHFNDIESTQKLLDPYLVTALIRQESAFNSRARSAAGARGLMQLMPATARQLGAASRNSLYDPRTNVRVGTRYFTRFLQHYNGDVELTLAAYNAGFSRVDDWIKRYPTDQRLLFLDLIPFHETRDYVSSILRNYYWYVQLYSKEPLQERLVRNAKDPSLPVKMLSLGPTRQIQ